MTEQRRQDNPQLEALLAAIDQAAIFVSSHQHIERCTPGAVGWLRASAVEGQALSDLFPADLARVLGAAMDRAQTERRRQSLALELDPGRLPAWRALGLRQAHRVAVQVVAAGDGWLLLLGEQNDGASARGAARSQRDPLTGAYNRRAFMPVLSQSLAQAQRYDWPCSVMMVAVDGLAAIGERYGLDTSARLLQTFVGEMQVKKRGSDFLARYDDDCLVMLMPETNLEQGLQAAARVRRLVSGLSVETPDGPLTFTLSIGVSAMIGSEDSVETLMARVGENLCLARQNGGNCCEGDH